MPDLPITACRKSYRGAKQALQRKTADLNRQIAIIERHANQLIAESPAEFQRLSFGLIALDLRVDEDLVRFALSDGGTNGRLVHVTAEDRERLAEYLQATADWPR